MYVRAQRKLLTSPNAMEVFKPKCLLTMQGMSMLFLALMRFNVVQKDTVAAKEMPHCQMVVL